MGNQIITQPQTFKTDTVVMGSAAGLSAVAGLTVYGNISASGTVYGLNNTLAKNEMTGTGGTTYTLVTYPSQNAEDYIVAVDGVIQTAGSAYSISGSSLIFTAAIPSGSSIVALVSRGITANSTNIPSFKKNELSTTSGTAAYTMSYYSNNNAENYLVFLDGVMQSPTTDYTIAGNQITLIPTPSASGLKLVVMSLQNVDGTYAASAAVDITGKIDKPSSPSAGQVLAYDGSTWVATASGSSGITQGTAVTLTTQTSATFTGIPSTAKRITVVFNGVSTSGSSIPLVRLGTSSGVAATGYVATAYGESGAGISTLSTTTGIYFRDGGWTNAINATGAYTCYKLTANIWTITGGWITTAGNGGRATGYVDLGNTLDRILLTTVNGTDTFDAGTVNIMWE